MLKFTVIMLVVGTMLREANTHLARGERRAWFWVGYSSIALAWVACLILFG